MSTILSTINATIGQRAQQWLDDDRLFIDTETTGLGDDAEIVEICVIDSRSAIILNTLVKPTKPIPAEVTAIHGITNEMVAYAPTWKDIHGAVVELFINYEFVIYNADLDVRLIRQTAELNGLGLDSGDGFIESRSVCAMDLYAQYRGEPGKRKGYKWHRLVDAAAHEGVSVEGVAHRALADCKMTVGIVKAMAKGGAV
ncbi:3'-5' exonuclease [Lonsdalea quercina]|uniref:3'-5' exonuclease n=1 Tax=Lonsdalea quercina TaxID=71657 RepID=UPI003976C7DE